MSKSTQNKNGLAASPPPARPSTIKTLVIYVLVPVGLMILPGICAGLMSIKGWMESTDVATKPSSNATTGSSYQKYVKDGPTEIKREQSPDKEQTPQKKNSLLETKSKVDSSIDSIRKAFKDDPDDIFKTIELADALLRRSFIIHDGGSVEDESIQTFNHALTLLNEKRAKLVQEGKSTTELPNSVDLAAVGGEELFLRYKSMSIDCLLSVVHSNLAKVYFVANMFDDSVDSDTEALKYFPMNLEARSSRGGTNIILGKYKEAANDYLKVFEKDEKDIFADAYTGLSKVLATDESAVDGGWKVMVDRLEERLPKIEAITFGNNPKFNERLKRMHLCMFQYHDVKTKDVDLAWEHLSKGLHYKMLNAESYNIENERMRVQTTKQIFQPGIWPDGVGSNKKVPIFIVGFVRSGSTLLERILDSHPMIVGTGEDSVFNGRLDVIRNGVVSAASENDLGKLQSTVNMLANEVITMTKDRWKKLESRSRDKSHTETKNNPKRFVDKMLSNYNNVGFIHMLFPKALILHVVREPMDTIFSAYKHDFPSGHLDKTSSFESLAQMYDGYRQLMDHWDATLPGRVTHVRYEDLVQDPSGIAKAVIAATGLPWDEGVLSFHKKKHAVNTLSTTQVRKGVYKDAINSWKKYEKQLKPLVDMIGERANYRHPTSLAGYQRPTRVGTTGGNTSSKSSYDK